MSKSSEAATSDRVAVAIDGHTGLGVNEYGCVCGWKNPDGTDWAQMRHAAEQALAALQSPAATDAAQRAIHEVAPDMRTGQRVSVAIAAISAAIRA